MPKNKYSVALYFFVAARLPPYQRKRENSSCRKGDPQEKPECADGEGKPPTIYSDSPKIMGSELIVRVASPSPVGKNTSQQSSFSNKGWRYVLNSVARAILIQEVTALLKQTAKIIDISL